MNEEKEFWRTVSTTTYNCGEHRAKGEYTNKQLQQALIEEFGDGVQIIF